MIRYYLKSKHEPWTIDEEQDCWVAFISCDGDDIHENVIEVRALNEEMLDVRVKAILKGLGFATV